MAPRNVNLVHQKSNFQEKILNRTMIKENHKIIIFGKNCFLFPEKFMLLNLMKVNGFTENVILFGR